jgi:citrate/tricarballylate utilization protein
MSVETVNLSLTGTIDEARRQTEICNACRYCEGYCAVFPAITRQRAFADADIVQLANLCHNCRGCYYACQFVEPHEFALNIPESFAQVRQESWQAYVMPTAFGRLFHRSGTAIAIAVILGFALLFGLFSALGNAGGEGFYAVMSHFAMVAIFLPAFIAPLIVVVLSLRRYWNAVGGEPVRLAHLKDAFAAAADMRNLSGGHGQGCNYEDTDRFSQARRKVHNFIVIGFLLCFASTSTATLMHYLFDMPAPYSFFSVPKLLGVVGGVLLSLGTLAMIMLKRNADRKLGDQRVWGGEMGFVVLLFFVSTSGLVLYLLGQTPLLSVLLALHLGSVLAFFLLTPYSKMMHGFFRLAALTRDAQIKQAT